MNEIATTDDLLLVLGLSDDLTSEQLQLAQYSLKQAESSIRNYLKYDPTQASRTEYYPTMEFSRSGVGVWEVNDSNAYFRELAGGAAEELQVKHIPIRSITSLRVDYDGRFGKRSDSFAAETAWVEGEDFWPQYDAIDSDGNTVCNDGIIRSEGRWPDNPGSVKIVYTAGYARSELRGEDSVIDASPLYQVAIDEARRRFLQIYSTRKSRAGFTGPFTSESLGDYSYSADSAIRAKLIQGVLQLSSENQDRLQDYINYGWTIAS